MPPKASRKKQPKRQQQQQRKTAETLSETTAASSKVTHTSFTPDRQQAKVNTAENGATAQVGLESFKNLHYMILGFQDDDDPDQPNPEHAARRQKIMDTYGKELLAAVKGWAVGKNPESDIVHSWWSMEVFAECHGGITPEGKALSTLMRIEAFRYLGHKRYLDWESENKPLKAATVEEWAKEEQRPTVNSQPGVVESAFGSPPSSISRTSLLEGEQKGKLEQSALPNQASTLTASPREDQAKEQSIASRPYVTQVEDLFDQLVRESQVKSRFSDNQESVSVDTASEAGRGASPSRTEADGHLDLLFKADETNSQEYRIEEERLAIGLIEHVSLRLLSRYKVSAGTLLDYRARREQETPEERDLRQLTAWKYLRNIMDLLIFEARQGNVRWGHFKAWWRTEVVVELSEHRVNQFSQNLREGLNAELREILGKAETKYKSEYASKHFVAGGDTRSQYSDATSAGWAPSISKAILSTVFAELRNQGSYDKSGSSFVGFAVRERMS